MSDNSQSNKVTEDIYISPEKMAEYEADIEEAKQLIKEGKVKPHKTVEDLFAALDIEE